jgi:hypothetical protein
MGYCNITHIQNLLANSLTTGTTETLDTPASLLEIGRVFKSNLITEDLVNQYIVWADAQVNGILSAMYAVPLSEKADFESSLLADIDEYNQYIIPVKDASFAIGDTVILVYENVQERQIIGTISTNNIFTTVDAIVNVFPGTTSRVVRVKYPDPIALISARLATANIYEKYFAAQSSPNESEFGKFMRKAARQEINNILNGRTRLHGEHTIGNRFVNSNIKSRYALPKEDIDSSTNIDDIG